MRALSAFSLFEVDAALALPEYLDRGVTRSKVVFLDQALQTATEVAGCEFIDMPTGLADRESREVMLTKLRMCARDVGVQRFQAMHGAELDKTIQGPIDLSWGFESRLA